MVAILIQKINIMETTKTKKIGRPLSEVEHKKICPVLVKFSLTEYSEIEKKAKRAGTNVTAFIRKSSLSSEVIARPTQQEMEDIRAYNNLRSGIGNNLNQLTKLAHQYGYSDVIVQQLKNQLLYDCKNNQIRCFVFQNSELPA
jgi:hypothetical protein